MIVTEEQRRRLIAEGMPYAYGNRVTPTEIEILVAIVEEREPVHLIELATCLHAALDRHRFDEVSREALVTGLVRLDRWGRYVLPGTLAAESV